MSLISVVRNTHERERVDYDYPSSGVVERVIVWTEYIHMQMQMQMQMETFSFTLFLLSIFPLTNHSFLPSMATINPLSLYSSSSSIKIHHFPACRKPYAYSISNKHRHYSPKSKSKLKSLQRFSCKASQVSSSSVAEESSANWVPVVPLSALPRGERRVIIQDGDTILLLWYKDSVFAIENRSPAEGAYSEGLINAKLTQDGCIVCPTTDSTFDLRSGEIKEWYPNNPVLRVLTPALRGLFVYPVKTDEQNIYISISGGGGGGGSSSPNSDTAIATEIVFSGKSRPGVTATDVNVDEVRMIVDEGEGGFGFSRRNEIINGKAATIGFLLLLDFELLTGKGLLKGTGFLDFLYNALN